MGYLANQMSTMGEFINHEMQVNEVFHLNIKNPIPSITLDGAAHGAGESTGLIFFSESVVCQWMVMGILIVLTIIITAGFRTKNLTGRQTVAEGWFTKFYGMVKNMLGHETAGYAPYMCSVLFFIGLSNIFGIFGMKPPTKDLNATAALALMSIIVVQIAGIRAKGVGGWAKQYRNPINILDLFTRPLSLCMRLFGNVLGAFVIMELVKHIVPVGLPAVFSLYFDIFDGLLQAYVFTFLTSIYINEAVE